MTVNPLTDINIFVKHLWASSISLNWRAPLHVAYELYVVLVLFYQNTIKYDEFSILKRKRTWLEKNKRKTGRVGTTIGRRIFITNENSCITWSSRVKWRSRLASLQIKFVMWLHKNWKKKKQQKVIKQKNVYIHKETSIWTFNLNFSGEDWNKKNMPSLVLAPCFCISQCYCKFN